ncbi:hypothetical protein C1645_778931 [Glomus cerebriforme]|uniref:Uncharacterized protein n=1 Tax=Glomus cerebriforme TaxID=658196 RepID=A0A397SUY0_9GLOM|nr:hypothetical protein C1645_778931 [Glomus cerebriforme]
MVVGLLFSIIEEEEEEEDFLSMAILFLFLFNIEEEELLNFFSKIEGLLLLLNFLFEFVSNPLIVFLRSKFDEISLFFIPLFSNLASLSFMDGVAIVSNIRAAERTFETLFSFGVSLGFSSSVLPVR